MYWTPHQVVLVQTLLELFSCVLGQDTLLLHCFPGVSLSDGYCPKSPAVSIKDLSFFLIKPFFFVAIQRVDVSGDMVEVWL